MASPSFSDRLLPAPVGGGFQMDDHWVWGGSCIRGEDGQYHLFVSIWPRALPFMEGYVVRSRVVRAVAPTPVGPYRFAQEILPPRDPAFWDGCMTHNPEVHRIGGEYVLFYIGSTYPAPMPPDEGPIPDAIDLSAVYRSICIGVATAPSVAGPWHRPDRPTFEPRRNDWDSVVVTNPTACVDPDGRVLMIYRSSSEDTFAQLGIAAAEHPAGPYRRLSDEPILTRLVSRKSAIEDPFLWHNGRSFEMIAKDLTGTICGEYHAGIHTVSDNGLDWQTAPAPHAYSRRIQWDDGSVTHQGCFERPKLLLEDGVPTHLFAATGDGPGGFRNSTRTWNVAVPMQPGEVTVR